jgi:hypothetical protein
MNDNIADDAKHAAADATSPQVAFEDSEAEPYDIDANEAAFGGPVDDEDGPKELRAIE